jgi:tRNA (adenine57-N1/adenine58-N1)-methyltransferase
VSQVGASAEAFDRCVLDLPEPWVSLEAIHQALEPGAVLCSYLPTTGQIQQLVLELPERGFLHVETFEVLRRSWHVTARSVRPDHRMVGHTGFLSVARRLA